VNLEVFLPWTYGDDRSCAALMATSIGLVRIGQQPVPYKVNPAPTLIPLNNPPAPRIVLADVDDRQTELTADQADLFADTLEGDEEAGESLIPLGIQVANGCIDQFFDLPHTFKDNDDAFTADLMWDGAPDGFPDAIRTVASITRRYTETADKNGQPPADVVEWAHQVLLHPANTYTVRFCAENPDTCQCKNEMVTKW